MKKSLNYINKGNISFSILIEDALVPESADYWGYFFKVTEKKNGLQKVYKAMIKKDLCSSKQYADTFIKNDPLQYLKSTLLENYSNESTPLLWPNSSVGWGVI